MAAMLTCGDFRNEKRVGFFNQQACVATGRTCSATTGKALEKTPFSCGAVTRSRDQRNAGVPCRIAIRLVYLPRSCPKRVLCTVRSYQ
jgi:hypothetical protein